MNVRIIDLTPGDSIYVRGEGDVTVVSTSGRYVFTDAGTFEFRSEVSRVSLSTTDKD